MESPNNLGAVIIVLSKDKKQVLLGKRKNSYLSGWFGLPGGRIESNEKVAKGALRELKEETGLKVSTLQYIGVVREQQNNFSFIHFTFLCHQYEGEPTVIEKDKCEKWEWFPLQSFPEKLLPGHKAAIEMFVDNQMPLKDI